MRGREGGFWGLDPASVATAANGCRAPPSSRTCPASPPPTPLHLSPRFVNALNLCKPCVLLCLSSLWRCWENVLVSGPCFFCGGSVPLNPCLPISVRCHCPVPVPQGWPRWLLRYRLRHVRGSCGRVVWAPLAPRVPTQARAVTWLLLIVAALFPPNLPVPLLPDAAGGVR